MVAIALEQFKKLVTEKDNQSAVRGAVYTGHVLVEGGPIEVEIVFWGPSALRQDLVLKVPYIAFNVRLKSRKFV